MEMGDNLNINIPTGLPVSLVAFYHHAYLLTSFYRYFFLPRRHHIMSFCRHGELTLAVYIDSLGVLPVKVYVQTKDNL